MPTHVLMALTIALETQQQSLVWRFCLVTKQWKSIFALHGLCHYQTVGYKDQEIGGNPCYLELGCRR